MILKCQKMRSEPVKFASNDSRVALSPHLLSFLFCQLTINREVLFVESKPDDGYIELVGLALGAG